MKQFGQKRIPVLVLVGILVISLAASLSIAVASATSVSDTTLVSAETDQLRSYIGNAEEKGAALAKESLEDVITTITFREALTAENLQAYVESYSIDIVQIQARGFDSEGNRITFFSRTDKGIEETYAILNELADSDGVQLTGIIGMYALIDSSAIDQIQKDRYTLVADTSADAFFSGKKSVSGNQRNYEQYKDSVSKVFPQSVAWEAEDIGLVDYTAK